VPSWLRDSWSYHEGDARTVLPELVRKLGRIDVFIHDSLHTEEHVLFELDTVCPYIRDEGIVIVDDALWNDAFAGFTHRMRAPCARVIRGVGVARLR
jgi:cephalosporin hydroxylase